MITQTLYDTLAGDRHTVIVQNRDQPGRIGIGFQYQQGAQLGIAVLFNHEHRVVIFDKLTDLTVEWKGPYTHVISMDTILFQLIQCFQYRTV